MTHAAAPLPTNTTIPATGQEVLPVRQTSRTR
jgi:hypothetical protein